MGESSARRRKAKLWATRTGISECELDAARARIAELEVQNADRLETIGRLAQEKFDLQEHLDALKRKEAPQ
jgi:predicted nuclease with TOPRIM domain